MDSPKNNLLIASDGRETFVLLNGKGYIAEDFSIRTGDLGGVEADFKGLQLPLDGGDLGDFCEFCKEYLGIQLTGKEIPQNALNSAPKRGKSIFNRLF